jgi:hypothetical protein
VIERTDLVSGEVCAIICILLRELELGRKM